MRGMSIFSRKIDSTVAVPVYTIWENAIDSGLHPDVALNSDQQAALAGHLDCIIREDTLGGVFGDIG